MEKELPCSSSPFRSRPVSRPRLVTLIILGVCAAVALSTALQLLLVDYFAVRYARQEAQLRLQQLSWQMRDALNHVMEEAAGNVALVAGLAPVREARAPADARSVLDNLQKAVPDYAWIGIADISGKVFAAAGGLLEGEDVSKRPWFSHGAQSAHPRPARIRRRNPGGAQRCGHTAGTARHGRAHLEHGQLAAGAGGRHGLGARNLA